MYLSLPQRRQLVRLAKRTFTVAHQLAASGVLLLRVAGCSSGGGAPPPPVMVDAAPAVQDLARPPGADLAQQALPDLASCVGEGLRWCGGRCVDVRTDPEHCGRCNEQCFGVPAVRFTCCAGECVGLAQDPNNCGACGRLCDPQTSTCCTSVCVRRLSCP